MFQDSVDINSTHTKRKYPLGDSRNTICRVCGDHRYTLDNRMIYCDGICGHLYHQYCLLPILLDIPEGDWYVYVNFALTC